MPQRDPRAVRRCLPRGADGDLRRGAQVRGSAHCQGVQVHPSPRGQGGLPGGQDAGLQGGVRRGAQAGPQGPVSRNVKEDRAQGDLHQRGPAGISPKS